MASGRPDQTYNDSAFLFLLFTLQLFILLFGTYFYLRQLFSKSKRPSRLSLIIKGLLLVLIGVWFYQVILLTQQEAALSKDFDPYTILGVPVGSFGSKEVKQAYRRLAVKYHPDKQEVNSDDSIKQFQDLVKAYEILTDEVKYDNWQKYGNPDGSRAFRAVQVALPSFLLKPENQSTVLVVFFLSFICLPIVYVFQHMKKREKIFKNGLMNENKQLIMAKAVEIAQRQKFSFKFTHQQVIEILEVVIELKALNDQLVKKTTVHDLLQQIQEGKRDKEFQEQQTQIQEMIPKINELLFDDSTFALIRRIVLQDGNKKLRINPLDIYQSFANYTSQLLKKETTPNQYKLELKSYVDGLVPGEPIYQNYLMTFELKISGSERKDDSLTRNIHYFGLLVDETKHHILQHFEIRIQSQPHDAKKLEFPIIRKFKTMLQEFGDHKIHILLISTYGETYKSNTVNFTVVELQEEEEDEALIQENQDEKEIRNLAESDDEADDEDEDEGVELDEDEKEYEKED